MAVAVTEISELLATRPGGSEYTRGYVDIPGTSGNVLTTPDVGTLDITADLTIIALIAPDDWTPASAQTVVSKWVNGGNQRSYRLDLNTAGTLSLFWSTTGADNPSAISTVAVGALDGSWKWVAATLDVDNGAANREARFWTSDDGISWTQLGATVSGAVTSIFNSTSVLQVGGHSSTTQPYSGRISHLTLKASVGAGGLPDGGTVRLSWDAETDLLGVAPGAYEFAAGVGGHVFTVNTAATPVPEVVPPGFLYTDVDAVADSVPIGSGDWRLHIERVAGNAEGAVWDIDVWDADADVPGFVTLPGVGGNYLSIPDTAAFDITEPFAIVVRAAADDWTPGAQQCLVGKWGAAGQRSYRLLILPTGILRFEWSNDGTTTNQIDSTIAPTIADGAYLWVAVSFYPNNGIGQRVLQTWTSDGTIVEGDVAWDQLGTTVTGAATTIFASTSPLEIGASVAGTAALFAGKIDNVRLFGHPGDVFGGPHPIYIPGGQLRFQLYDADFTGASPFTSASGHTVTLNTSGGTPATITAAIGVVVTEWAEFGWESMRDFVRGVDWFRGAQSPQGRPDIGEIGLTLGKHPGNEDRFAAACDPWVNYQNTRSGTVIRAALTSRSDVRANGWLPLWAGVVESWLPRYSGATASGHQADVEIDVRLVETLSTQAMIDANALGSAVGSGERIVARADRLLNAANWQYGRVARFGPAGASTIALQSTDMAANRLTELYLSADSSLSVIMSDATGACLITDRSSLKASRLAQFSTANFGFGDQPMVVLGPTDKVDDDLWHIAYDPDTFEAPNDPEPVINDHRYTRVGGTQQLVVHEPSKGAHGHRVRARGDLICTTDGNALAIARADNDREARTSLRVEAVDIAATKRPNALLFIAAADWGDGVWMFPPSAQGFTGSGIGKIRAIYHQLTPAAGSVHWTARLAVDFSSFNGMPGAMLPVAA